MGLFDLFDSMGPVGAKTWVAPVHRSATSLAGIPGSQHPHGSLTRRSSVGRLDQARQDQLMSEKSKRLREQRLAELAKQLELTELQNKYPQYPSRDQAQSVAPPLSRPLSPVTKQFPEGQHAGLYEELAWQQQLQEAHDVNAKIESLRLAGMPADQLPSPVQLPSRPLSRARLDDIRSNRPPSSRDYPLPPFTTPVTEAELKRQASKRSLHSVSSSRHTKSPPPAMPQTNSTQNRDQQANGSQAGYYQALKEAEQLIHKLRESHDQLLERVQELEEELKIKDLENQDLIVRNNKLEAYLVEEQNSKETLLRENEKAMLQLRALYRIPSHFNRDPQARFYPQHEPKADLYQERAFQFPPAEQLHDPNISQARAELLRRMQHQQRQYEFDPSDRAFLSNLTRPTSNKQQPSGREIPPHPDSNPVGKNAQSDAFNEGYPSKPSAPHMDHPTSNFPPSASSRQNYPNQNNTSAYPSNNYGHLPDSLPQQHLSHHPQPSYQKAPFDDPSLRPGLPTHNPDHSATYNGRY